MELLDTICVTQKLMVEAGCKRIIWQTVQTEASICDTAR